MGENKKHLWVCPQFRPPKNLPLCYFYPQKVRCSRPTLRECSPLLKITKKDQKIHFNRLKQVYPQRHGSCFAGGLHLAGALCLFKLLFHCRFNVCNSRAADIKFTGFLSSFCFQCFESERVGEYLRQSFQRAGVVFFRKSKKKPCQGGRERIFRMPSLNVSNNSSAAKKTRCSTVAWKASVLSSIVSAVLRFPSPRSVYQKQHLCLVRFRVQRYM